MTTVARKRKAPTPVVGELLTPSEAAAKLRVQVSCWADWRFRGKGPQYLKVGGRVVRYPSDLLDAWIAQHLRGDAA